MFTKKRWYSKKARPLKQFHAATAIKDCQKNNKLSILKKKCITSCRQSRLQVQNIQTVADCQVSCNLSRQYKIMTKVIHSDDIYKNKNVHVPKMQHNTSNILFKKYFVLLSSCPFFLLSSCPLVPFSPCPLVLLSSCPFCPFCPFCLVVLLSFCRFVLLSFCLFVLLPFLSSVLWSFVPLLPYYIGPLVLFYAIHYTLDTK